MDLLYFPIISYYLLLSGIGKCRINHDPTIGEIISSRYFFKWCSKSSKTNIYQPLPYPLGLSKNEEWAPHQVDFRGIPKCGTYPGYGSKRLEENAEICWILSGQILNLLNSRRSARFGWIVTSQYKDINYWYQWYQSSSDFITAVSQDFQTLLSTKFSASRPPSRRDSSTQWIQRMMIFFRFF